MSEADAHRSQGSGVTNLLLQWGWGSCCVPPAGKGWGSGTLPWNCQSPAASTQLQTLQHWDQWPHPLASYIPQAPLPSPHLAPQLTGLQEPSGELHLQSPSHRPHHCHTTVTMLGSGTAACGTCHPDRVGTNGTTDPCACPDSACTQPSLIGSQEHNFSSNYIFSTSEKMRFW